MTTSLGATRTFLAVLFLGMFALAARNVTDPDIWWHLKTGEFIAAHHAVPHTDPFSFTRSGEPWVAHEWLTDLLLYEFQQALGWGSLIVIFAAILSSSFFLLYLRCRSGPYLAGVATLAGALATMPVWGVRPQVLSLLLTSLWLLILDRAERSPNLLWWTLPVTLLWVNLHAGFALGLALSAIYLAVDWIENSFHWSAQLRARTRTGALVLLVDILLVPLNPNGGRLFFYPIETLRSAAMQNYIVEWASPNFHRPEYLPFLLLAPAAFGILSWSPLKVGLRQLLLLLISFYASLCSIRMIPFFVLIAVPIVTQQVGAWHKNSQRQTPRSIRATLNATIVAAMMIFALVHVAQVIERQPQAETKQFPARAVAFLQAHPPFGRIFNHYDWGGYLIWKLYPSTPVFIDGRADLYGEPLLDQFADTYQFKGAWQNNLRDWNIDTVVVPGGSALATGLRTSAHWTLSYEDAQAVIFSSDPGEDLKTPAQRSVTPTHEFDP